MVPSLAASAKMHLAAAILEVLLVSGTLSAVEVKVPGSSSAGFPAETLEADDQCLSGSCGSAFIQTHGLALRSDGANSGSGSRRKIAKVPPPTSDDMYAWLQKSHPGQWGDVIDAGTGPRSLLWLASCPLSSITAVTANESSKASTLVETKQYLDLSRDKVVVGQWQDSEFLRGRQFDTVVADWLLGAVEFFAPHYQVSLIRRLHKLVKPGGWLLFDGREPDDLKARNGTGVQMMLEIDTLRDAASILSQRRPYREIPQWWVEEQLTTLGFKIHKTHQNPIWLTTEYVQSQLEWAGDEIKLVKDDTLRSGLEKRLEAMKSHATSTMSEWKGKGYGKIYGIIANLA